MKNVKLNWKQDMIILLEMQWQVRIARGGVSQAKVHVTSVASNKSTKP
jgi:hypothetical protein